jgi:hypothetical protein
MNSNPVAEVARFFNTKHSDHYRIVNLCPERQYPYNDFNGRVVESFMGIKCNLLLHARTTHMQHC